MATLPRVFFLAKSMVLTGPGRWALIWLISRYGLAVWGQRARR